MFPKFDAAFKDAALLALAIALAMLVSGCRRYHYDVIVPQQGAPADDASVDSATTSEDGG